VTIHFNLYALILLCFCVVQFNGNGIWYKWYNPHQRYHDAEDDEDRGLQICQEDEGGDGHAGQGKEQISVQLVSNHLKHVEFFIFVFFIFLHKPNII
jgi:hypothetical protein